MSVSGCEIVRDNRNVIKRQRRKVKRQRLPETLFTFDVTVLSSPPREERSKREERSISPNEILSPDNHIALDQRSPATTFLHYTFILQFGL